MRQRSWTVSSLASESDLDTEQVLVALWSEGIEYPIEPSSRIRPEDAKVAERATGIAGSRAKRIAFWLVELGITRDELAELLAEAGLTLHKNAQTLPKGAVRRIRAQFGIGLAPTGEQESTEAVAPLPIAEPFSWTPPGRVRDCSYLSAEELLQVHEELTSDFAMTSDPIFPPGVKSHALLGSSAGRPATSFGGAVKYPTVESAAAALLHSVVHNHPFHNGNKRTALVSTLVFLDRHGLILNSNEEELFRFMIRVAAHDLLDVGFKYDMVADREVAVIAAWLATRTRIIRKEERAVTWRELARTLKSWDCSIVPSRGDKVSITREIRGRRRLLGGYRTDLLETFYINTGDGREVPRRMLKKIRQELHLDVDHGVDSEAFYGSPKAADFFIMEYSGLLRRLARV